MCVYVYMCTHMYMCVYTCMHTCMWMSELSLQSSVLSVLSVFVERQGDRQKERESVRV